ncbi:MAG TPA: hypothetical protein VFV50_12815 [Bdellovibrionales bacterium]|nr:hypothetical protein [Bdellovibrionales bacterium]
MKTFLTISLFSIAFSLGAGAQAYHGSCEDALSGTCTDLIGSLYADPQARKEFCDKAHSGAGALKTVTCKKRYPGCRTDAKTDIERVLYVVPRLQPFLVEECKNIGGVMDPKTPVKHVTSVQNLTGRVSNFSPFAAKDLKVRVGYSRCTSTYNSYCNKEEWASAAVPADDKGEFRFSKVGWGGLRKVYQWKVDVIPPAGEKAYSYEIPDLQTEDELRAHAKAVSLFHSPKIVIKFVDRNGRLLSDQEVKDRRIRVSYTCSSESFSDASCVLFYLLTIMVQKNAAEYAGRPYTWPGTSALAMNATATYTHDGVKKASKTKVSLTTKQFPLEVQFALE